MANQQYKLLIVDDSASIRELIIEMLSGHPQYNLLFAQNGVEACNMALNIVPDLILTDIEMPVMNGIKAIKKIKQVATLIRVPIIVMSSSHLFSDAISAGAQDFLIKPFTQYELLLRINQNLFLAEKELKINQQHELVLSQQRDLIKQNKVISDQQTDFMSNLRYARYVQKAILPSNQILGEIFSHYFVYDKPKDIVSGDFYWVYQKNNLVYIVVGDCTGHGVAGALLTMAGITFLNEIISLHPQISANQIINILRNRVTQLLNQHSSEVFISNGMDLSLCIYNQTNGNLQFAGANNPLYIVRTDKPIEVIRGDRMPIGFYYDKQESFTNHEFQTSKGDMIFLFTDGYPDQFGGINKKKFHYKQFRQLLNKAAELPSPELQLSLIQGTMNRWMEGFEQVDDMLVLGIRL
jgi:serine phosphatase RsbU (regulator of sigma subunit)